MSANSSVEQWLVGELRFLAGFDEVEEMASYLMTLPNDAHGLAAYMGELLGTGAATSKLASALVARRTAGAASSGAGAASGSSGMGKGGGDGMEAGGAGARVPKASKSAKAVAGPLGGALASSPGLVPTSGNMPLPAPPPRTGGYSSYSGGEEKRVSQKERARLNRLNGSGGGGDGGGAGGSGAACGGAKGNGGGCGRAAALPHVGGVSVVKRAGDEKRKAERADSAEAVAAVAAAVAAAEILVDDEGFQVHARPQGEKVRGNNTRIGSLDALFRFWFSSINSPLHVRAGVLKNKIKNK
jgi:hypothetical protein